MDWASTVGKPSAFLRRPGCGLDGLGGAPVVNVVIVLTAPLIVQ